MLNHILVALLTGATALGIPMGDQENHNQASNAPNVANVQRAYYDSSAVANYGTDTDNCYNYSSYTITYVVNINDEDTTLSADTNETLYPINLSHYSDGILGFNFGEEILSGSYEGGTGLLDLYVNGTYYATLDPSNTNADGSFNDIPLEGEEIDGYSGYFWLFDHGEGTTMEQGIFEVVGDSLTAFASTIGVGFTAMIQIFYNDGVTPLGILALIVAGISLVWFAWNLISGLLRQRR